MLNLKFWKRDINKPVKRNNVSKTKKQQIINELPLDKEVRSLTVGSDRLTADFEENVIRGSVNPAIRSSSQQLMDQAQTIAIKSVYGKKAVQYSVDNVIGSDGILPNPKVMKDDVLDVEMNRNIEYEFDRWARKGKRFSATGQMNFRQFQQQIEKSRFIFGEAFAVIHESDYNLHVELISPQRCKLGYTESTDNGNTIVDSIEYTPQGRVVAYYFELLDMGTNDSPTGKKIRIDADDCYHYFIPTVPGQRRGISEFAPVVKELVQLDSFTFSTLVQKRMASNSMGFITQDKETSDAIDIELDEEAEEGYEPPDILQEFEAGTMHQLAAGQDIKQITATQGADDYATFNSAMESKIAMGFGFFKQGYLGDTSNINYSSARFGDAQQRNMIKSLQSTLRETVLEPLFERWLEWNFMNDKLVKNERQIEYIAINTDWLAPKWESIDPMKDMDYESKAVENGFKTRRDAIIRLGGDDADATFAGIESEKDLHVPKQQHQLDVAKAPAEVANDAQETI